MRASGSAAGRCALALLLVVGAAGGAAPALAEDGAEPFSAHHAGLLLDRSFADRESCEHALTEARRLEAEEKERRPEHHVLFAHARCDPHQDRYAIRMHWPRRTLAVHPH